MTILVLGLVIFSMKILVVGLVISAMTMTDMISGLIIGRVVDIYTNTRYI